MYKIKSIKKVEVARFTDLLIEPRSYEVCSVKQSLSFLSDDIEKNFLRSPVDRQIELISTHYLGDSFFVDISDYENFNKEHFLSLKGEYMEAYKIVFEPNSKLTTFLSKWINELNPVLDKMSYFLFHLQYLEFGKNVPIVAFFRYEEDKDFFLKAIELYMEEKMEELEKHLNAVEEKQQPNCLYPEIYTCGTCECGSVMFPLDEDTAGCLNCDRIVDINNDVAESFVDKNPFEKTEETTEVVDFDEDDLPF